MATLFNDIFYIICLSVFLSVTVSVWQCCISAELQVPYEVFCVRCSLRLPSPQPIHLHHVSFLQLCAWESTCLRLEICVNDSHLGQLMRPWVAGQGPLRCLAYLHSPSLSVFWCSSGPWSSKNMSCGLRLMVLNFWGGPMAPGQSLLDYSCYHALAFGGYIQPT